MQGEGWGVRPTPRGIRQGGTVGHTPGSGHRPQGGKGVPGLHTHPSGGQAPPSFAGGMWVLWTSAWFPWGQQSWEHVAQSRTANVPKPGRGRMPPLPPPRRHLLWKELINQGPK